MLIAEGLWLMLVGMFVVFSFLILLVVVMKLSAKFFAAFADYFPEPIIVETMLSAGQDQTEIAAVLAAVYHFQYR